MAYMAISSYSCSANTTTSNLIAGKSNEYLTRRCLIRVAPVSASAGIFLFITCGARQIVIDEPVNPSNRWPIDPDDFIFKFAGRAGEKLDIRARNSTGSAINLNMIVDIVEV